MSLIKLQGNASGTGTFTIASPSGNTDRTLTLPDATGTLISGTIDGSGNVAFAGGIYLGGSGSANLLNDYEEGTFSPSITGWTGTYNFRFGFYTKIGNWVHLHGSVKTNGGTGTFSDTFPGLTNYPFTGSGNYPAGSAACNGVWFCTSGTTGLTSSQTASGPLDGPGNGGTGSFANWVVTGGNVSNWTNSQLNAAAAVEYRFNVAYRTA